MRDHCVDIQLICAVISGEPVLSGVMIAVLLRRKGGKKHANAHYQCQQHGNSSARKCMIFVQVLNSSLKFLGIEMLGSQLMLLSSSPPSSVFLFAGTRSSPSRCGASPVISHIPFPRIFFGAVPPFLVPVYPYPNKERSA